MAKAAEPAPAPAPAKAEAPAEKSFQEQLAELDTTPIAGTDMTEKVARDLVNKGQGKTEAKTAEPKGAAKEEKTPAKK